jgi:acetyl-CoA carboxylase, biotin carboxylase subunit
MIQKVLVANRGEIAVRIMRSCREMGISTVAVFSEVDRTAMHVRYANEAYCIGPAPSVESYLNIEKILEVAKKSGSDAIHPGYGFLSENAHFAERCREEGVIFIGPSPSAIRTMGDKITARKTMIAAGIPVVPGTVGKITSEKEALSVVEEIGLPVMIKASAGGGGKGMRLVKEKSEILSALRAARSEAASAFGDDSVFIEKYIESPHHIEYQILADKHGHTVHLFERECSVQRRHQKVVEETPSPLMTPQKRIEMGQHAVAAAQAVDYFGAGTIEFIMDDNLNYYFLEMNTRLQVEHPITERVVGIDLVKAQIDIANEKPLPFSQEDLFQHGHAIECRIYAEDTDQNFMPNPGVIRHITEPYGTGIRCDGYVYEGYEIPIYYDSMITKLIVWGCDRQDAIDRMKRALYEYKITGVKTSIRFLKRIMDTEDFRSGHYNTHFIENNKEFLFQKGECFGKCEDIALIATYLEYMSKVGHADNTEKSRSETSDIWRNSGRKYGISPL